MSHASRSRCQQRPKHTPDTQHTETPDRHKSPQSQLYDRPACHYYEYLSGCVDRYEDHVGAPDLPVDVRGKKQVASAALLDNVQEPGLVDGQIIGIPCIDLR